MVVNLREYESYKLPYEKIRGSGSGDNELTDQNRTLCAGLKEKLDITELTDGLSIVAKQHVGVAHFDGFTVNVRPKIAFKNTATLPRMVEFAHSGVGDSVAETEFVGGGDALREILIRSIVKKTEKSVPQGHA